MGDKTNRAVFFAILRLCLVPHACGSLLKHRLNWEYYWSIASDEEWHLNYLGHHYWTQSCRGSCPVLVLDSWIGVVEWKDALRTRSKPSLFFFFFFNPPHYKENCYWKLFLCSFHYWVSILSNGNIFSRGWFGWNCSLFLIFKVCPTHGFAYGCSCVMSYGLLHTLLPLGLCFVSLFPYIPVEKLSWLSLGNRIAYSKMIFHGKKQGRSKSKYISQLFSSWSQHHHMAEPQWLRGGGRQLVINIYFQNEMGASFLCCVLCVWYHHAWVRTRQLSTKPWV